MRVCAGQELTIIGKRETYPKIDFNQGYFVSHNSIQKGKNLPQNHPY
jgi:hypothetical protein